MDWTPECEAAFDDLKKLCSSSPILAYAYYGMPFQLHTDASICGLGAVLYQRQDDGADHVITYASHMLIKAEKKYDAHKLEFVALKWSISEWFHEYLYGGQFEVFTDNNPLTYTLTTAKLDTMGQQWVAGLANYHFSIHYHSGRQNVDADALSQVKWEEDESTTTLDEDTIRAIIGIGSTGDRTILEAYSGSIQIPYMSQIPYTKELMEEEMVTVCGQVGTQAPAQMSHDWVREQELDAFIAWIIQSYCEKQLFQSRVTSDDSPALKAMLQHRWLYCETIYFHERFSPPTGTGQLHNLCCQKLSKIKPSKPAMMILAI